MLTLFHLNFKRFIFLGFYFVLSTDIIAQNNCLTWTELKKRNLEYPINSKNFLIEYGGGKVYKIQCDSISRIDKSFSFKTRFGALNFVYNDKLYSFGGYGIFQFNNSIISFDVDTGQWHLHYHNAELNSPKPRRFMIGGLNQNDLIIGPGTSEKYNDRTLETADQIVKDFWLYDLKNRKWEKLNEGLDLKISDSSRFFNLGEISIISGEQLIIIDYKEKQIKRSTNPKQYILHNAESVKLEDENLIIYSSDESFTLPLSSFIGDELDTVSLKSNDQNVSFLYSLVFIVFILGYFIFIFYWKKSNKWYMNLSEQQLKLINCIESSENPILYKELYKLYDSHINYETLKGKLRRDLITIEEEYFYHFKKKYIQHKVDSTDKRLKRIHLIKK